MKIKTTLLTLVMLISVNLSAQNQTVHLAKTLSINAQSEKLSAVFKLLELQAGFTMTYSSGVVNDNRRVTISASNKPLSAILESIFQGTNVLFKELGDKVLLFVPGEEEFTGLMQTVRGRVIDPESNQPVIGANVIIPNSEPLLGASTDLDGYFKIENVPVGRQNFRITFLGYKTKMLSNISVDSGKEVVLNVGLEESVTELEEVVVVAEIDKSIPLNEMALISAKSFTVEETSRYAGSFNDPARMATTYAGVTGSTDDTENSIIIRGNSPRGLLWRLEGMEIPNPNHFATDGASSGAISMLNSNVLANSDFMTGAFPAEYGNAFSGVFDLKLRNGNNEKREYAIQAGLLGVDASFEGPIKRTSTDIANASYLINYRYSTITVLESLGLDIAGEGEQVPAFQDLAFKLNVPTRKLGTFSIYGLGGISEASDVGTNFFQGQRFDAEETEKYTLGLMGISNVVNLSQRSFLETSLSLTHTRYDYFEEQFRLSDDRQSAYVYMDDTEDYKNDALRFSSAYSKKHNARHSSKMGLIYSQLKHKLNSFGQSDRNVTSYQSSENGDYGMIQGYFSHKVNLTDQLAMTGGFHYLRLGLDGQDSFEPRFGLKWQFAPNQSFSFGFGVHSRREEASLYFTELAIDQTTFIQPNTKLDLAKARHYVIGYDRNFGSNVHLKLEAYYQDLYNIPVSSNPFSQYSALNQEDAYQRLTLINAGKGENYGLELTFEKFLSKGYFFLFTGSLYESKYETLGGIKYNTRYNGKYNLNFVAGREFNLGRGDRKKTLNIGLETVFAGGTRVREIDLQSSIDQGGTVYFRDSPFGRQLQDYQRVDFQIALKTNRKKVTHELKLDVQNLTSRTNVVFERFNPDTQQIEARGFAGELIPVLSYKLIF